MRETFNRARNEGNQVLKYHPYSVGVYVYSAVVVSHQSVAGSVTTWTALIIIPIQNFTDPNQKSTHKQYVHSLPGTHAPPPRNWNYRRKISTKNKNSMNHHKNDEEYHKHKYYNSEHPYNSNKYQQQYHPSSSSRHTPHTSPTSSTSTAISDPDLYKYHHRERQSVIQRIRAMPRSNKKRDPLAPKRNLSAYLLYQNAMRDTFRARNPGMDFGEYFLLYWLWTDAFMRQEQALL